MTVAWSASSDLDGLVKDALDELSNQEFIRNQERGRDLRNKMEPRSDIYLDSEIDANSGKIPFDELGVKNIEVRIVPEKLNK